MTTGAFTTQAIAVLRTLTPTQLTGVDVGPLSLSFFHMLRPDMAPDAFTAIWDEARAVIQAEHVARRHTLLTTITRSLVENPALALKDEAPAEWAEYGITQAALDDFRVVVTCVCALMPPPETVRESVAELKPRPIRVPLEEKTTERETGDYTPDQIAEGFGVSLGVVHTWMARGCLETAADGQVREKIAARFLHHHPDEVNVTSTNGIWLDTLRALPKNGIRPSCSACRKAGRTAA